MERGGDAVPGRPGRRPAGFPGEPGFPDPEARAIGATCAGLRVWSVYVPNGRTLDDDHYPYKLAWWRRCAAVDGG